MADFLPVPVHAIALFVPESNGVSRESKLSFPVSQQKNRQDTEQNPGQGKKQADNNIPEEINFQSPQNLKLDLPTSVRLHWFLPHALTGNVVKEQISSFPVVPKCRLVNHHGRSDVKQRIARNDVSVLLVRARLGH